MRTHHHLQPYVPLYPDGSLVRVLCHGDGLSCERMVDAKRARAECNTSLGHLMKDLKHLDRNSIR